MYSEASAEVCLNTNYMLDIIRLYFVIGKLP